MQSKLSGGYICVSLLYSPFEIQHVHSLIFLSIQHCHFLHKIRSAIAIMAAALFLLQSHYLQTKDNSLFYFPLTPKLLPFLSSCILRSSIPLFLDQKLLHPLSLYYRLGSSSLREAHNAVTHTHALLLYSSCYSRTISSRGHCRRREAKAFFTARAPATSGGSSSVG